MRQFFIGTCLLLCTLGALAQSANEYFSPLKYRNIGPFRGGRSVTATGVVGDPMTYYMGITGGGVWKTEDAGVSWHNISDGYFKTGSVGAVAVSESDPNVIYVGMGEHAPRGVMTSYGDGVYKSTDAGKTWAHLGLETTEQIARIVIHPKNPDVVYIAAQGRLNSNSEERGVYRSQDGGATWEKTLYVNDMTGASELSMDMSAPNILYATMWEHQRKPWVVISGGEGSGVYKSVDSGKTWKKIEKGLPNEKGKMAISVSRANADKVYLLMESDTDQDKGGLFVSNNGGDSWRLVSGDNRLTQRAWYYTEVFTDPNDENTVYVLSAPALRSIDGGKTWERLSGTHGDYHDLWINPDNSKNMVIANDGGAAVSFNYGQSWSPQDQMPTAQFYRINVDNQFPYNIYGGQQDNSSVKIASQSFGYTIGEKDWESSAGGESAFLAFDPDNPRYVMGGSYLGTIELLDTKSQASTGVMAAPIQYLGKAARDMKYLYNWNAPIIWSKHEPGTFYHAAQLVLRTRDNGVTWEEASPDLTRNIDEKQGNGGAPYTNEAVGAENYGTITYLVESPHEKGLFYTGSDDGMVHVTKDNMESWQEVTPKGLSETLVNAIEVSPHDPATVYIATTKYKWGDKTPAIYKSTNYGRSWKKISDGIPMGAYTRVVREDQSREGLLYAGTETGLYISWNGGDSWEPFQLNMPVTPINDLKVHQNDLVVATSGRSFWILDNLNLLAQYESTGKAQLYQPEDLIYGAWGSALNGNGSDGKGDFEGVNPANGVVLYYELPKLEEGKEISMEIVDAQGEVIRTLTSKGQEDFQSYAGGPSAEPTLPKSEGLNRFVWDTRHHTMPGIPTAYIEASYRGHKVPPGTYQVTLKVGEESLTTSAQILPNPLYEIEQAQYEEFDQEMTEMEAELTIMHNMVNQLKGVQDQLKEVLKSVENEALKEEGNEIIAALDAWDKDMVQRKSKAYDDVENFPNKFTAEYMFLINASESSIPRINQSSRERREELDMEWKELRAQAETWINETLPAYNKKLWEAGIGAIRMN